MAVTTGSGIVDAAYIKVGIDAPTTAQYTSGLVGLNNLVSQWGGESLIYCVTSESFTVSTGDEEYTIGSGGDWDTIRPLRVESCFLRDADNYDYPVVVMDSKSYNSIRNKTFDIRPVKLYFLPEYPLAKIIFDAAADADYTAYFEFIKSIPELATIGTTITMPDEYKEALVYNMAISLGEDFDRVIGKTVIANAIRTKDVIRAIIAAQKRVPETRFNIPGRGGGYNIVTDSRIDGGAF